MPRSYAVVVAGCGSPEGSDLQETVLTLLALERSGIRPLIAGPDDCGALLRRPVVPLDSVEPQRLSGVVIPGGPAPVQFLSNYREKGAVCDVHPAVASLLKEMLAAHKPMGFLSEAAILAARVLGPAVGVRLTVGSKAGPLARDAAVMGADVRFAGLGDLVVDRDARVVSTPGFALEDARLPSIAKSIDKLVSQLSGLSAPKKRRPSLTQAPPLTVAPASSEGATRRREAKRAAAIASGRSGRAEGGNEGRSGTQPTTDPRDKPRGSVKRRRRRRAGGGATR